MSKTRIMCPGGCGFVMVYCKCKKKTDPTNDQIAEVLGWIYEYHEADEYPGWREPHSNDMYSELPDFMNDDRAIKKYMFPAWEKLAEEKYRFGCHPDYNHITRLRRELLDDAFAEDNPSRYFAIEFLKLKEE